MGHDVFVSHSSQDRSVADAITAVLEMRGMRCWIAPRDVRPGAPYGEEILDAIYGSRVMVLVLSANANLSPHIPKEVERAVSRGVPVIPLRIGDVLPAKSLDYFIGSIQWLDALTPPIDGHLERLADSVQSLLISSDHGLERAEVRPQGRVAMPPARSAAAPPRSAPSVWQPETSYVKRTLAGLVVVGAGLAIVVAALAVYALSR